MSSTFLSVRAHGMCAPTEHVADSPKTGVRKPRLTITLIVSFTSLRLTQSYGGAGDENAYCLNIAPYYTSRAFDYLTIAIQVSWFILTPPFMILSILYSK